MTNEELRDELIKLSKRTGFSIQQIAYIARMIAQAEYDPMPPEKWGQPHDDRERVPLRDFDDFCTVLKSVPPPDAQVDLRQAFIAFEEDRRNAETATGEKLLFDRAWLVFLNGWDWARFWAARHPRAKARLWFSQQLAELDDKGAEIVDRAEALLARRGMTGRLAG